MPEFKAVHSTDLSTTTQKYTINLYMGYHDTDSTEVGRHLLYNNTYFLKNAFVGYNA